MTNVSSLPYAHQPCILSDGISNMFFGLHKIKMMLTQVTFIVPPVVQLAKWYIIVKVKGGED